MNLLFFAIFPFEKKGVQKLKIKFHLFLNFTFFNMLYCIKKLFNSFIIMKLFNSFIIMNLV